MIRPARRDIVIPQRGTLRMRMRLKSAGQPLNATGYQLVAQVWDRRRTQKLADFTPTWITQTSGLFELLMQWPVTTPIVKDGEWDLMVIEPGGDRYFWLEGRAIVDPGYSAPVTP